MEVSPEFQSSCKRKELPAIGIQESCDYSEPPQTTEQKLGLSKSQNNDLCGYDHFRVKLPGFSWNAYQKRQQTRLQSHNYQFRINRR